MWASFLGRSHTAIKLTKRHSRLLTDSNFFYLQILTLFKKKKKGDCPIIKNKSPPVSHKVTIAFSIRTHEVKLRAPVSVLRLSNCRGKLFIGYGLRRPLRLSHGGTWFEERLIVGAVYHGCHLSVKENPKWLSPLEAVSNTEWTPLMKDFAS